MKTLGVIAILFFGTAAYGIADRPMVRAVGRW